MASPLASGLVLGILAVLVLVLVAVVVGRRFEDTRFGGTRLLADGGYLTGTSRLTNKPTGLIRWLTTVDHKDIGILYLVFGTVAALWGGMDAMMMRTELVTAQVDVWNTETYNQLFTTHGLTMLFFFATPVFTGIGNYVLPLLIGADDMAFPRINAIAFWLLPPALLLVRAGLVTDVVGKALVAVGLPAAALLELVPPAVGWTMYVPMSQSSAIPGHVNPQVSTMLLGLHLSGVATTMAAINFVVTIFTERPDEVGWDRLDIFSWALLTTSAIIIFAFPLLGSTLVMLLLDRTVETTFFTVNGGGPMLFQHLFWFFGHPEVYILVLPAFGLVSFILPKFCGRKLFGFRFIVYSTLAIGVLSFGVWAHHMFATGADPRVKASFMVVSVAIAVPSAVKTFNWITTMWNGRVRLTAPMLFCIGSIALFIVGGVTGVFLASIPVDLLLHGTYYVVGHFHLIIVGIIPFSMFAASYYWYPLITGRLYNERLARVHAWLSIVGVALTFVPLLVIGYAGLPRRYASYPVGYEPLQQVATVGAYLIGVGVILWLYNMLNSLRTGPRVRQADVWNLEETDQFTREWQWFEEQLEKRRED
ncbi:cbb3-type cytochrome c oxidase subunit I [Haloarchaeobius amylolyticus]|uniref:cbb3-type cytochrome c oxidase subunit I n=1 Tax=Haloarchaeobius amylolyticus TaxID=1198296 RepID=UPI002270FBDD|nr:cbb3-type cytochrome c oxidase subunit I [Haloarchaeobius amylolyticus]